MQVPSLSRGCEIAQFFVRHTGFSPSFQNLRLVGTRDNMSADLTRLRDSNSRSQSTLSEHFSAFFSPIRY